MDDPPHHRFISARQLNNSGVLLELDSQEAAVWQGKPLKWASFLGCFSPEAAVKMRSYPVIVQFVPLYFKLEGEADLKTVEADNKLPTGALSYLVGLLDQARIQTDPRENMWSHLAYYFHA